MISRAQQILVKRAQREAGMDDAEYRDALEVAAGCRSTKAPAMTDRGVDLVLGYFEAIFWRKLDAGELQAPCRPGAVFQQRGFWARRNPQQETSRDRYIHSSLARQIADLESALAGLGFDASYCAAIRQKVTHGRTDAHSLRLYSVALQRTLRAKRKIFGAAAPG